MDFSALNKLEFENLDNTQEEKENPSQEEAINYSCKIIEALAKKKEEHNKENPEVNLTELKSVFRKGSLDCKEEKTCLQLGFARVNLFLRMKMGDVLISEISESISFNEVRANSLIDVSEYIYPSEKDFIQADEDIKKFKLDFNFNSSEELYLEDESSFGIIMERY